MKKILFMLLLLALPISSAWARDQVAPAMDTSIVPTQELSLTKIVISDDADHTIDLSLNTIGFTPMFLLARSDGDFHEGPVAPNQSNDIWRDSIQIWSLAVNGRSTWHFRRRTGAGTVTIYLKVLGSS